MVNETLAEQLLSLPLIERIALAALLWQSIDAGPESDPGDEGREAVDLAKQRAAELDSGAVTGGTHAQVMDAARRVLECR